MPSLVSGSLIDQPFESAAALPGYRFLHCYGRAALGERWRVAGPDGRARAVTILYGFVRKQLTEASFKAAQMLARIRHPGLAVVQHVSDDQGRLLLVTDLCESSLRDRFEECRRDNLRGIPRDELLDRLQQTAQALDFLHQDHHVRHFALNGRNILLEGDQVRVSEFGLAELLWSPGDPPIGQFNPRYAAPELFEDWPSASSDQYALALLYQELLTGQLPHRGNTVKHLLRNRIANQLDLDPLPGPDRAVVQKALDPDPNGRYESCLEFVLNLRESPVPAVPRWQPTAVDAEAPDEPPIRVVEAGSDRLMAAVQDMLQHAGQTGPVQAIRAGHFRFEPDGTLVHRCAAWLVGGVAQHKLDGFLQRWKAEVISRDAHSVQFRVCVLQGLWQRLTGSDQPTFEITIRHGRTHATLTEVAVRIRHLLGNAAHGRRMLEQFGPVFLEDLHNHLMATPERRVEDRFALERPLQVASYDVHVPEGPILIGKGKDISSTGIGLYLPKKPTGQQLFIYQEVGESGSAFRIPAAVTRIQRLEDGWYETGARFMLANALTEVHSE